MDNENKDRKVKIIGSIIGIISFVLVIVGLTYAYFYWQIDNTISVKLNVDNSLSNFIVYNAGTSILSTSDTSLEVTDSYSDSDVNTTIEFWKDGTNKTIYGRLSMKILDMLSSTGTTDANISKTSTIKWVVTTYNINNNTEVLVNQGDFYGKSIDETFSIAVNFELNSYQTFYKVYLWIDKISIDLNYPIDNETLSVEISAEATDTLGNYGDALETLNRLKLLNGTITLASDTPDFSKTSCTNGTNNGSNCDEETVGLYETVDDLGTSYYFRGDVSNNYVYFAGFYWRIIRINGDGTIRLIYDGTTAHDNGESSTDRYVGTSTYKSNPYGDNTYVGYMYGNASASTYALTHDNSGGDSTIKNYLENTWYANNILNTEYEDYIADAIYCNDRTLSTASTYTGNGISTTYYAPYQRIYTNKVPSLLCSRVEDRFATKTNVGVIETNGKSKYPIGLITADEVAYAGGLWNTNNYGYYLYMGSYYWTLSPSYFSGSYADAVGVNAAGYFNGDRVYSTAYGVRPALSLKSSALNSGSGTKLDPFTIS